MTAQISDLFKYKGCQFQLVAFSDCEPFDPKAFGYRPVMASTACYRGYVCEYKVDNDSLLLNALRISHQENDLPVSQKKRPPDLNGVKASVSEQSFFGRWVFQDLNMPLNYSGGLILGQGFIKALYVHMGFHPAWKYEEVHELVFESGKLVSESDLSRQMLEARERMELESSGESKMKPSKEEIAAWVNEYFKRDYTRKS